jgi:hypothetical protein
MQPNPNLNPRVATWVALAAVGLLIVTNIIWLFLYSSLAQRAVTTTSLPSPAVSKSGTPTPSTSASPAAMGTISGAIAFPAGTAPAQMVCAQSLNDANAKYCADQPGGNSLGYSMKVPVGSYYVYASLKTTQGDFTPVYKAYYNRYVTCQSTGGTCSSALHSEYIAVKVVSGGTATNINPTDWYAPAQ